MPRTSSSLQPIEEANVAKSSKCIVKTGGLERRDEWKGLINVDNIAN